MTRAVLIVACLMICHRALAGTECDDFKTPQQVLLGLTSTDELSRITAKECGADSDSRAVRAVVVQKAVMGLKTMSFQVDAQSRDVDGAKLLQRFSPFVIRDISWNDDGRSFKGSAADGQLVGGSLAFAMYVFIVPEKPGGENQTQCSANLNLAKGDAKLAGTLQCKGISNRFIISLGL